MTTVRLGVGERRAGLAATAVAGLALAACGSSDQAQNQGSGPRAAPSIVLSATLSLSGAVTLNASFRDAISSAAAEPTCVDAIHGYQRDGPVYDPPQPPTGLPIGGHTIRVFAHVQGYHGPDTYPAAAVVGVPGSAALISIDGIGFGIGPGANATLAVRGDDSGVLAVDRLVAIPIPPQPGPAGAPAKPPPPPKAPLTGTLTWTCATERPPGSTPSPSPAPPG